MKKRIPKNVDELEKDFKNMKTFEIFVNFKEDYLRFPSFLDMFWNEKSFLFIICSSTFFFLPKMSAFISLQ